jgi:2-dehydropantoate 2-reductase
MLPVTLEATMNTSSPQTLIVGAGALGAMYAERLVAADMSVAFLADADRAARLRETGVTVNGRRLDIPVVTPAEYDRTDGRPVGFVLVALKDQHVAAAAPMISAVCGPDTTLFSVMNGIDSEERLAAAIGDPVDGGRVLLCMVAGMDAVRDANAVEYTRLGTVFIGERRNVPTAPAPRVEALQHHLQAAGIPWKTPEDMEHAIWNKFMLNVGINQWSAVLGARYGVFHRQGAARDLMRDTMAEVLAVARSRGVALSEDDLEGWFAVVGTLGAEGKTSMLQDVEAGRKTEVEMFAGRVVEMGEAAGIPTPLNRALLRAINAIEVEGLRAAR